MDFEKLKKALKNMSSKPETEESSPIDTEPEDDFAEPIPDSVTAPEEKETADNISGDTQRIDLKAVLNRFRTKYAESDEEERKQNVAQAQSEPSEIKQEPQPSAAPLKSIDELTKTVGEIDKRTAEITVAADENQEKIAAAIVELNEGLSQLRSLTSSLDEKQSVSVNSVMAKLNTSEKKLNDLINSSASISKLNDSIFDLKNSQMNTKNSLGDLEAAFYKLKRKMTTGILIISIISAVIAILEIINLLS